MKKEYLPIEKKYPIAHFHPGALYSFAHPRMKRNIVQYVKDLFRGRPKFSPEAFEPVVKIIDTGTLLVGNDDKEEKLPYRRLDDGRFQVFRNDVWESIDIVFSYGTV